MHHRAATIDNSSIFPSANDAQRERLLVVDDHADIRERHAHVLKLNGYEVETACNGAAALERCAEEEFDLVVSDRAMPILDGVSMALALRSAGSNIPIVMVSRSLATASLPPHVAREFSTMLPKPARSIEILSAVSGALYRIPAPGSVRRLPPIVRTVLTQAVLQRLASHLHAIRTAPVT
jgi:CheY-like chemotaxis protein